MSNQYKQIPMSEMRVQLPKLRRLVQLGKQRIVVTYYGEIIGFLLPLEDINQEQMQIITTKEMSLSQFRNQMTEAWELLQAGADCIYLTFHTRQVLAFLSARFSSHLDLPVIGDPNKMYLLIAQSDNVLI